MHHFAYKDGLLHAEGVPLENIAEAVGTPFYCYSSATLERHYRVFAEAFDGLDALICYSVKSNSNIAVLRTLALQGAGADVVSLGELLRAVAAGIPADKIVFSGVGKTTEEMAAALEHGIYQFNVESEPELLALDAVAREKGVKAPVTLRVNPDVDARTHAKISTGLAENKFGIPWRQAPDLYDKAGSLRGIEIVGIDVHIGSQVTALEPLRQAFEKLAGLVRDLRAAGHDIARIDLGGGLGIPYAEGEAPPPHPKAYGEMIAKVAGDLNCRIILEPGRLISGNAGILLSRVIYLKEGEQRRFLIIDAAMNDLMRPALYDAHHEIIPVRETEAERRPIDIVGPVCESTDVFARARPLPPLKSGDLVAIMSAGAYGAVMASTYNSRPLVPEVLVRGDKYAVIRDRPPHSDLIAMDSMAPWLRQ